MLSLRHMSLVSLMDSGAQFKHGDPLYEDIIWEAENMRLELSKKMRRMKKRHVAVTKRFNEFSIENTIDFDLHDMIGVELFDKFSYRAGIEQIEVPWKEYFHVVYDLIVPNAEVGAFVDVHSLKDYADTRRYFEMIEPPSDTPPTQRVRHIYSLLKQYTRSMDDIDIKGMIGQYMYTKTEIGRSICDINRHINEIAAKLDVYTRIVDWSMY